MFNYYQFIKPLLFQFDEEKAHNIAIKALKYGFVPPQKTVTGPELKQSLWGIEFINPVGLAAGFDKNANASKGLIKQGFGFVETGTVTPKAQAGNSKPRIFRLKQERAIINSLGFNNDGLEPYQQNLSALKPLAKSAGCIIGANIGKNKESPNDASDYTTMLEGVYGLSDYITVNISSPNTPNLRALQKKEAINDLVTTLIAKRDTLAGSERKIPLLIKLAPDLTAEEIEDIGDIILESQIDGAIVSNTTIRRDLLASPNSVPEAGGLSGRPLFKHATDTLKALYRKTNGTIPIIGVGGIESPEDAYLKIRAGASFIQVYSALIYKGFSLVNDINTGIINLLKEDGFTHISQAIGIDSKK